MDAIIGVLGEPDGESTWFADVFAGSGVVSGAAASEGWRVMANDHLRCASALTSAELTSVADAPFDALGGYESALSQLNAARSQGFIFREYAPTGASSSGHERRYFTPANAAAIDGARSLISLWASNQTIGSLEENLLIADLLVATSRVSNTAGTYGAFLREFSPRSLANFHLRPRQLRRESIEFKISSKDVFELSTPIGSVSYLDPPYTKRQYAAYYHVLETIAIGDKPTVEGVTGLRPWRDKSSPFCFKRKAARALGDLCNSLAVTSDRLILSYSDDGHADLDEVRGLASAWASSQVHRLDEIERYRPNAKARAGEATVGEWLLEFNDPLR